MTLRVWFSSKEIRAQCKSNQKNCFQLRCRKLVEIQSDVTTYTDKSHVVVVVALKKNTCKMRLAQAVSCQLQWARLGLLSLRRSSHDSGGDAPKITPQIVHRGTLTFLPPNPKLSDPSPSSKTNKNKHTHSLSVHLTLSGAKKNKKTYLHSHLCWRKKKKHVWNSVKWKQYSGPGIEKMILLTDQKLFWICSSKVI